ncbi:hypothetical protein ACI0YW_000294 [Cronobacter sakazakii]
MWNKESAIAALNSNANATSQSKCAKYVRLAIKAGGVNIVPPPVRPGLTFPAAADYGSSLEETEQFNCIYEYSGNGATLADVYNIPGQQAGDVVVIAPIPTIHMVTWQCSMDKNGYQILYNPEVFIREEHMKV